MAFTLSFGLPDAITPDAAARGRAAGSSVLFLRVLSVSTKTASGGMVPIAIGKSDKEVAEYFQVWLQHDGNRELFTGRRRIDLVPYVSGT